MTVEVFKRGTYEAVLVKNGVAWHLDWHEMTAVREGLKAIQDAYYARQIGIREQELVDQNG